MATARNILVLMTIVVEIIVAVSYACLGIVGDSQHVHSLYETCFYFKYKHDYGAVFEFMFLKSVYPV
jgi:hypothetical protein